MCDWELSGCLEYGFASKMHQQFQLIFQIPPSLFSHVLASCDSLVTPNSIETDLTPIIFQLLILAFCNPNCLLEISFSLCTQTS